MQRFIALVALVLLLPASAQAWWNTEWTVRKKITLDTQAAGVAAEAASVPVLVRLSTGNFDFLSAKDDGSDIRFLAQDDVTPLKFHVERYSSSDELAFVWVQVPRLAGADNTQHIWLYSGNEKAPSVADSKASYDASHLVVYHLNETAGLPQDATANGNHVGEGRLTYASSGLIAGGARLAADGGLVLASPALQTATEITVSAWIKPERPDGELLSVRGLTLALSEGVPVLTAGGTTARATAPIAVGTWQHIAVTAGPEFTLYVDGKPVATLAGAKAATANLRIGAGLTGEIDEVQVSTVLRGAAWLAAQVESQGPAARLVKYGEDSTTDSSEGPSYFAITMNNVTLDGWVVVVMCLLMFVVALWVMVSKAVFLRRVRRANEEFAEAFGEMSRGLAGLDGDAQAHAGSLEQLASKGPQYRHSPLYRIYQVGVTELKHRFPAGGAVSGMPAISARSMNAVRASLDAQLTREGQRMNRAMVLLTIAISGGPFLGLLGTVVGVMITFAAIAAAGDVNVNAIAPGIAAALVATVAGLGVAIPALFGYNYLLTVIKNISADMQVFVDEFVARMAESYGG